MKIAILLKNGPCTDEAGRALQTADDMLAQGNAVSLYLLHEAVRACMLSALDSRVTIYPVRCRLLGPSKITARPRRFRRRAGGR